MAYRAIGQEQLDFADRRRTTSSLDEIGKLIDGSRSRLFSIRFIRPPRASSPGRR